jgi:lysozyme family protein
MRTPDVAFREAIERHEGGFQADPDDRGNWVTLPGGDRRLVGTRYGVTAASLAHHRGVPAHSLTADDVRGVSLAEAAAICATHYYQRPGIVRLIWAPATDSIVDMGYNAGPRVGIRMTQRLCGAVADGWIGRETITQYGAWLRSMGHARACAGVKLARDDLYRSFAKSGRNAKYLAGWLNRSRFYSPANAAWWASWVPLPDLHTAPADPVRRPAPVRDALAPSWLDEIGDDVDELVDIAVDNIADSIPQIRVAIDAARRAVAWLQKRVA